MIDMAQIELDRLLDCTVDELIALVKPRHARRGSKAHSCGCDS